jgi:hypothetical protein
MSTASTNDVGAGACIKSVEVFFDGFNTQYCELFGKYHIRVRDLIIGICIENPDFTDQKSQDAVYVNANQTWRRIKEKKNKENKDKENLDMIELRPFLQKYQFEGEIYLLYYLK